jgi:hypothetical protein
MTELNKTMYAWATGLIEISNRCPHGAITVARGPEDHLRISIVAARLGYNGEYIVPNVPEAPDSNAAVDALIAFRKQIKLRLSMYAAKATEGNCD